MASTDATGTLDASLTLTTYDALDRRTVLNVGGQDTAYTYDLGGRTLTTDDGFTCASSTFDYRDLTLTTTTGLAGTTCSGGTPQTVTNTYDGLGRLTSSTVTAGTGTNDILSATIVDSAGNALLVSSTKSGVMKASTFGVSVLDATIWTWATDQSATRNLVDAAGNATDRCYWTGPFATQTAVEALRCAVVGTSPWPGGTVPTQSTSSVFDARNSRIQQVDSLTNEITLYDPTHNYQVDAVYLPTGSGYEHQTDYAYDAHHRLDLISQQVCLVVAGGHACQGTPVQTGVTDYGYDDNDNRTQASESSTEAPLTPHFYCYDARNQLTKAAAAAGCVSPTETYAYDDAGNRTAAPGRAFTYTADGQLATCTNPACAVSHDTAGRISSFAESGGSTWSYLYDAAGRLTAACRASSCGGTGFDRLDMTYDGEGKRTHLVQTPATGSATTIDFRYQGAAVAEETQTTSGGPTISRRFIVDDTGRAIKLSVAGDPVGANNGTYVIVWNGHGDATGLWRIKTDGTLEKANTFTYDTWGRPARTVYGAYTDLGFRYLYVGAADVQWDDAYGAGLLYMHARSYSPTLGRFLQPDPIAAEGNLYAYAENSPVTKADPSGRFWWFVAAVVAVVVRVAVAVVRVAVTVARAAPRLIPAAAGAWLRAVGYRWGPHLAARGISLFQIARTILFGQSFRYLHDGQCKIGFYLAATGLFVATSLQRFIFTAFYPGNPVNYITNLKASPC